MLNWSDLLDYTKTCFFLIAGPCVIEEKWNKNDSKHPLNIANFIRNITDELNIKFIFKASFDKANRTRLDSYRGPGLEKGLKFLSEIKSSLKIPVLTDVHETNQIEKVARVVDVIQIPAFLCRQTDLLIEAGKTGLPVNIKKGQFMSAQNMFYAIEKIQSTGNNKIMITERGTFFGYSDLVVDFRNFQILSKDLGSIVVFDCTHSVQKPGASSGSSGGSPEFIEMLAKSAIASNFVSGLFMETHPDPSLALSDGLNMLPLYTLKNLLLKLQKLYITSKKL